MKYYKIIIDSNIIGIGTTSELRSIQTRRRLLMACLEKDAECIQIDNNFYHAGWMKRIDEIETQFAEVVQIEEEEYNLLKSALEENKEDVLESYAQPEYIEPEQPIEKIQEVTDDTLELLRSGKISEMNKTCNKTIISGFDLVLSDNLSHHFDLTEEDQINLMSLSSLINSGETQIPYHASNELCKFYSVEDITNIINEASSHKTYHVSYFNSLKNYINSLSSLDDIKNITYGVEIPVDYQSEVLKALMLGGNSNV